MGGKRRRGARSTECSGSAPESPGTSGGSQAPDPGRQWRSRIDRPGSVSCGPPAESISLCGPGNRPTPNPNAEKRVMQMTQGPQLEREGVRRPGVGPGEIAAELDSITSFLAQLRGRGAEHPSEPGRSLPPRFTCKERRDERPVRSTREFDMRGVRAWGGAPGRKMAPCGRRSPRRCGAGSSTSSTTWELDERERAWPWSEAR